MNIKHNKPISKERVTYMRGCDMHRGTSEYRKLFLLEISFSQKGSRNCVKFISNDVYNIVVAITVFLSFSIC